MSINSREFAAVYLTLFERSLAAIHDQKVVEAGQKLCEQALRIQALTQALDLLAAFRFDKNRAFTYLSDTVHFGT